MADDKSKPGVPERIRMDVSEAYELSDWSRKFGVTREQLKAAVKAVGTNAADIERYLEASAKQR